MSLLPGIAATLVLLTLGVLELVAGGGAGAALLPPLVAGLSAADEAAAADALAVGVRALQLLLLNLYFAAQALLFAPSSAMRALRADAARGVDTQLRALCALLPELAARMEGAKPRLVPAADPLSESRPRAMSAIAADWPSEATRRSALALANRMRFGAATEPAAGSTTASGGVLPAPAPLPPPPPVGVPPVLGRPPSELPPPTDRVNHKPAPAPAPLPPPAGVPPLLGRPPSELPPLPPTETRAAVAEMLLQSPAHADAGPSAAPPFDDDCIPPRDTSPHQDGTGTAPSGTPPPAQPGVLGLFAAFRPSPRPVRESLGAPAASPPPGKETAPDSEAPRPAPPPLCVRQSTGRLSTPRPPPPSPVAFARSATTPPVGRSSSPPRLTQPRAEARALLASLDAAIETLADLPAAELQRSASRARAAAIVDALLDRAGGTAPQRFSAASGATDLSAAGSPKCGATGDARAALRAGVNPDESLMAPPREVPWGLVGSFLGEEMLGAQLHARCEGALRDARAATLRLREVRRRRRGGGEGGLLGEFDAVGWGTERALGGALPLLRLASRLVQCTPLPLCRAAGAGAWSVAEEESARARLRIFVEEEAGAASAALLAARRRNSAEVMAEAAALAAASETPSETEAPLVARLRAWVRAVREHDLAALGFVHYDTLPPPRLAPREQSEWRTLCDGAAGRLSAAQV